MKRNYIHVTRDAQGVTSFGLTTVLRSCVLTVFLSCGLVYGQISTQEKPVSFTKQIPALSINEQSHKVLPPLDLNKIEQEDKENEANGMLPRFGFKHEVSYNLTNSGEWLELPDGDKIWRLSISCPNATSINLLYDRFWLPQGAKYFIYSNDYEYHIGAFTSRNNRGSKEDKNGFATGLIYGDHITLEYYLPKEVEDMGIISVSHIVHGYKLFESPDSIKSIAGCPSGAYTNVACYPAWQNDADAVVRIVVNGNAHCTGALINTTANENSNHHFLLTADHCLPTSNSPDLSNWLFQWHYEWPKCKMPSNSPPVPVISTRGAKAVAFSAYGDFALLELDEDPEEQWDVTPYYLGWDRSGNIVTGITTIHHPYGSTKIISGSFYPIEHISKSYNPYHDCSGGTLPTHWKIEGYDAPPLPGSSGAPLLNNAHKLIGQHSGFLEQSNGHGSWCEYYSGKFSYAWEGCNADSTERLKDWLDPINTGQTTLDGRSVCQKTIRLWRSLPRANYHAVDSIISKQEIANGKTVSYKAGDEIVLLDGFHASSGANFSASIETLNCNGTKSSSSSSQSEEQNYDRIIEDNNLRLSQLQNPYEVSLFPNPANGKVTIEGNGLTRVELFDVQGRKLSEYLNLNEKLDIDVTHFDNGIYFVKLYSDNITVTKRLVVIK